MRRSLWLGIGRRRSWPGVVALAAPDTTPDAFTFIDQTNVGTSSTITSPAITVSGLSGGAATVTASGGTANINGGAYSASPGTAVNGDLVRARHTSSASLSTAVNTIVTIGGVSDTFTSTTAAGAFADLAPSDLTFLGYHRLSQASTGSMATFSPNIGFYRVSAAEWTGLRCFISGNTGDNGPVFEFTLAGAPSTSLASSPVAALRMAWGNLNAGRIQVNGTTGAGEEGQVIWGSNAYRAIDANTGYLIQTYGSYYTEDGYANVNIHKLNVTTLTVIASYGPFKFTCLSEMARGCVLAVPSGLQSLFGGKEFAAMGYVKSGIASKPHGPNLEHFAWVDPATLTASPSKADPAIAIPTVSSIRHDSTNRKSRDTRYRFCGWNVPYDPGGGGYLQNGPPTFNGTVADPATEGDTIRAQVFVRTSGLASNKQGLLCFGQLVRKPNSGFSAVGDADGYPHAWYGDPSQNGGYPDAVCTHGQGAPDWGATGGGYNFRQNMGWIYPVSELANAYSGAITHHGATPSADAFELSDYHSDFAQPAVFENYFGTQAWFDEQTNRVFVTFIRTDPSNPGYGSPVIAVFQVN